MRTRKVPKFVRFICMGMFIYLVSYRQKLRMFIMRVGRAGCAGWASRARREKLRLRGQRPASPARERTTEGMSATIVIDIVCTTSIMRLERRKIAFYLFCL